MCTVCGCGEAHQHGAQGPHDHPHEHDHGQHHHHYGLGPAGVHVTGMSQERIVRLEQDILSQNDAHAARNRQYFESRGILALNLVSSPGSGKTTLLERSIVELRQRHPVAVIEGDQQTRQDAERIEAAGARAVQINTGKGCHLDGHMVAHALETLAPADDSLLFIENVGNLVCPAVWDLGEAAKVAILSVTEGEDKPLKYPDMFAAAQLMILNKTDLLPHVKFDVARCIQLARRVNPAIEILQLSATTGEGMDAWLHWLDHAMGHGHHHHEESAPSASEAALRDRVQQLEAELAKARAALSADAAL